MSTLRVNNMTDAGGLGSTYAKGHVVQVVQGITNTQVVNSTSSNVDTGLTATITPKFANSKILVIVNQNGVTKDTSQLSGVTLRLLRGSTEIAFIANALGFTNTTTTSLSNSASISFLDSPNTTSPIAYKTVFANNVNAAAATVQNFGALSTITLMEVAA